MKNELITIGVDVGGTNTALGIMDLNNLSLYESSFLTSADEGIFTFVKRLSENITKGIQQVGSSYELQGIGVAAPGADYFSGIIGSSANLKWEAVNFVSLLKENFDVPVTLINDANAAALGEQLSGAAANMNNFIVITLGTGLGTGIVLNGELLYGEHGFAGELGHTIIKTDGRECNCGRAGCLETYVSANGIRRTVLELLADSNLKSDLRSVPYENITGKLISELAKKDDPIAVKAFEYTGEILGKALANIVTGFDPGSIILTGGLMQSEELLLKPTRFYFDKYLLNVFKDKVTLKKSDLLNGKAAIIGSISYLRKSLKNSVVKN